MSGGGSGGDSQQRRVTERKRSGGASGQNRSRLAENIVLRLAELRQRRNVFFVRLIVDSVDYLDEVSEFTFGNVFHSLNFARGCLISAGAQRERN
jgi:hypothetical protein